MHKTDKFKQNLDLEVYDLFNQIHLVKVEKCKYFIYTAKHCQMRKLCMKKVKICET